MFSERSWLEQGYKVGELVVPLARNFNNASINLESGSSTMVREMPKIIWKYWLNLQISILILRIIDVTIYLSLCCTYV